VNRDGIRVEIKVFADLSNLRLPGLLELSDRTSLEGLLGKLAKQCSSTFEFSRRIYDPENRELNSDISITVNGHMVPLSDLSRELEDKDRIAFFSLLSGG
jgi:molybdopterin converting factor small subunit